MKVIILGAGITGLSTAYYLEKYYPDLSVTVLEKGQTIGGWLQTEIVNDFLFEKGPRSLKTSGHGKEAVQLLEEIGLEQQIIGASPTAKKRYVWHQGKLHPAPDSLWKLLSSPLTRGLVPQLLSEGIRPAQAMDDESIYEFFSRRYSPEVVERLIDPLTACIYGGDTRQLSIRNCFAGVKEMEEVHGSLLKGLLKKAFKRQSKASPFSLITLKNGLQSLTYALARSLKGSLIHEAEALSIESHSDTIAVKLTNGSTIEADQVISTLPPHALARLVNNDKIAIPAASLAVVNVGWNTSVLKQEGFGCVFPSRMTSPLLGIVWDSSAFPQQNHHPHQTRLTLMLGGTHHPQTVKAQDADLKKLCLELLEDHLGITQPPETLKISRAVNAIPQYPVGHHHQVQQWKEDIAAKHPRLLIIGTACDGVAVGACIANAKKFAKKRMSI